MLIVFVGRGTPIDHATGFVVSEAQGRILSLTAPAEGPAAGGLSAPAGGARMKTVVSNREGRFWEAGRVEFPGIDSWLDVDTPEPGAAQTREDGSSFGSISWRVLGGGGRFEGACGIVTGNFTGDADGGFVDHQLYKLFLPA